MNVFHWNFYCHSNIKKTQDIENLKGGNNIIYTFTIVVHLEDLRLKRAMQNINIVPREHCSINSISEKIK